MALYRLTSSANIVVKTDDGTDVNAADTDGFHGREYAAWLAAGNVPDPAPSPPLAVVQAEALDRIDAAAGRARLRYITDVPGQVATYQLKEQQARAFVANPAMTPAPPLVQAEADATGMTPLDAAQLVVSTADQWLALVPAIERERRRGKVQVDAATTAAAVQTSTQAAIAALDAI